MSMPDVNDECVAVIADDIQCSCRADVTCIAPEAAKDSLDDSRTLQYSVSVKGEEIAAMQATQTLY